MKNFEQSGFIAQSCYGLTFQNQFMGFRREVWDEANINIQKQPFRVFLGKGVRKIHSKLTREHPCRSVISIKLLRNFIEITLRHRCFPVNLMNIFRTTFYKNTYRGLLLNILNFRLLEHTQFKKIFSNPCEPCQYSGNYYRQKSKHPCEWCSLHRHSKWIGFIASECSWITSR